MGMVERVVQPIGSTPDQNARSDGMGGGGRAGGRVARN